MDKLELLRSTLGTKDTERRQKQKTQHGTEN